MKGGVNVTQDQFERLYETSYMRVFSYAMTLTGDRNHAEEITQETFFRAFSRQSSFREDKLSHLCQPSGLSQAAQRS